MTRSCSRTGRRQPSRVDVGRRPSVIRPRHDAVLVLWSEGGALDTWYAADGGPLGIWSNWTVDVRGRAIAGGHFFPEQNAE